MKIAQRILIYGVVQGVGFRPFVFRKAKRWKLSGWVRNGESGVEIHVEGDADAIQQFVQEITDRYPSSAKITNLEIKDAPLQEAADFEILASTLHNRPTVQIPADLAVCPKCLSELFDPANRDSFIHTSIARIAVHDIRSLSGCRMTGLIRQCICGLCVRLVQRNIMIRRIDGFMRSQLLAPIAVLIIMCRDRMEKYMVMKKRSKKRPSSFVLGASLRSRGLAAIFWRVMLKTKKRYGSLEGGSDAGKSRLP